MPTEVLHKDLRVEFYAITSPQTASLNIIYICSKQAGPEPFCQKLSTPGIKQTGKN